jgi:hypothetical protein
MSGSVFIAFIRQFYHDLPSPASACYIFKGLNITRMNPYRTKQQLMLIL